MTRLRIITIAVLLGIVAAALPLAVTYYLGKRNAVQAEQGIWRSIRT